jgi:putative intracellular protease/amidase
MRVLFLLFPDQGDAKELRMERLAGAYYWFKDLRFEVVLASPAGGSPMASVEQSERTSPEVSRFAVDANARDELADTISFGQVIVEDFGAAYCLGVTGPIWAEPGSESLIGRFLNSGKPVAVIPGIGLDLAEHGVGSGLLIVGQGSGNLTTAQTLSHFIQSDNQTKG